jgi:hypothetical protein
LRLTRGWILTVDSSFWSSVTAMHLFLSGFEEIPDHRAENARHDLGELLVIAFVSYATSTSHRDFACVWDDQRSRLTFSPL